MIGNVFRRDPYERWPVNYNVGDVIMQFILDKECRLVLVKHKYGNVKHGLPGFTGSTNLDSTNDDSEDVWGYDFEVYDVVLKAE